MFPGGPIQGLGSVCFFISIYFYFFGCFFNVCFLDFGFLGGVSTHKVGVFILL